MIFDALMLTLQVAGVICLHVGGLLLASDFTDWHGGHTEFQGGDMGCHAVLLPFLPEGMQW